MDVPSEMVERVAQAIAASEGDDYLEHRKEFDGYARAAIEAMMEPTPGMVASGVEGYFNDTMGDQAVGPRQAAAVFKAMLSAALSLSPSLKEQERT